MKVLIYDNDQATLDLLKIYLTQQGHAPLVFPEPHICAINHHPSGRCPAEDACADAVIVNMRNPTEDSLHALTELAERNCKVRPDCRAIMSSNMTGATEEAIRALGFHTIRKPFRLAEIVDWLERCAS